MAALKMSEVKMILNIGLFKSRKSSLISDPVEGRHKICSYCEGALLRSVPARSLVIQSAAAAADSCRQLAEMFLRYQPFPYRPL